MFIHRALESYIRSASEQFPVILLTGARQVGKTTLLQHLGKDNRTYVTLDDPLVLELATEDPALFLKRFPLPVIIDEIQYAPGLLPYIKMAVDRDKLPGQFWLTGSQQFHLMQGVSESLAGRVGIIQLLGLSLKEARGMADTVTHFLPVSHWDVRPQEAVSLKDIYRAIWRGSFPALTANKKLDRNLFYSSYVQTYLQRDVRDLARVGDERAFLRFLRAAAARTGQLLNLTDLARAADIAPNTAKNWLSILEASGIIYLLAPYYTNVTKRLVKTPKLYLVDTGLCAYLTEWSSPETLEAGAISGAIFETWVVIELLKTYWHCGRQAPFYFYRDKDKKEIDLVILLDNALHPIEIKKSASPRKQDIRHFNALERLGLPLGAGTLICLCDQLLPLTETVYAVPVTFIESQGL